MKEMVLIGASGFVGSAILNEALNRGIKVRAIVRHPEAITIENQNLSVVKGDIASANEVIELTKGFDTVVSAYNAGWKNPNQYSDTMKVYPAFIDSLKKAGVKRVLMVGGAGSLFVKPNVRVMDTGTLPEEYMPEVKALAEFYDNYLLKEKDIDWVFFCPAGNLFPGERTGHYRLGHNDLIVDSKGESNISVQDFAKAMVDEFELPQHARERFTIGY